MEFAHSPGCQLSLVSDSWSLATTSPLRASVPSKPLPRIALPFVPLFFRLLPHIFRLDFVGHELPADNVASFAHLAATDYFYAPVEAGRAQFNHEPAVLPLLDRGWGLKADSTHRDIAEAHSLGTDGVVIAVKHPSYNQRLAITPPPVRGCSADFERSGGRLNHIDRIDHRGGRIHRANPFPDFEILPFGSLFGIWDSRFGIPPPIVQIGTAVVTRSCAGRS